MTIRALLSVFAAVFVLAGHASAAPAQERPAAAASDVPTATAGPASSVETATMPLVATEGRSALPRDLSPWGMFVAADAVVKVVMIGLSLASLATWTVWLAKSVELAAARRRVRRAARAIAAAKDLDAAVAALGREAGPAALLAREAREEAALSAESLERAGYHGLKERVASRLGRIEAAAARRMTRGTGALATIGSTAPFVGLFGTVWGIMNAFIGISEAQTTNLAVVAPGIAEALLATAMGLVAAIPAVVVYNTFARAIGGYRLMLADASSGVERLVSRDIDRGRIGGRPACGALAAE